MLASITPLGERGRNGHWGLTVTAFVLGACGGGALAGAMAGSIGALLLGGSAWGALGSPARLAVLAAGALVALAIDALPVAVPGPGRQVDERWLDEFRGWVYGLGYGAQLGTGVSTVVTSAATYLALLAALLVGNPVRGAAVMGCYGAVRGLSLLAGARVRTPTALFDLHQRLARGREEARIGSLAVITALAAVALLGALS